MEKKNKEKYSTPKFLIEELVLDSSIVAGSAKINTGWDQIGSENAPKETSWEYESISGNDKFDI